MTETTSLERIDRELADLDHEFDFGGCMHLSVYASRRAELLAKRDGQRRRAKIAQAAKAVDVAHVAARPSKPKVPPPHRMQPENKSRLESFQRRFDRAVASVDVATLLAICQDEAYEKLRHEEAREIAHKIVRPVFTRNGDDAARIALEGLLWLSVCHQQHVREALAIRDAGLEKVCSRLAQLEERLNKAADHDSLQTRVAATEARIGALSILVSDVAREQGSTKA